MRTLFICISFLLFTLISIAQKSDESSNQRVNSVIDSLTTAGLILKQTFIVNCSLNQVWDAYTTEKGWESWATSIAEIDFRKDGTIMTNYNKNGKLGDESTITLNILDYEPKKMIRLQAELTKHFPDFMQKDEKDLYNEILFEEVSPVKTRVISYGIGYKNNEKYKFLMEFFIKGNEQSYLNLISYLETGKPSVKY